jgi:hypothetical protein
MILMFQTSHSRCPIITRYQRTFGQTLNSRLRRTFERAVGDWRPDFEFPNTKPEFCFLPIELVCRASNRAKGQDSVSATNPEIDGVSSPRKVATGKSDEIDADGANVGHKSET